MSQLYVDTITEKTAGNGVQIPGHVVQVVNATYSTQTSTTSTAFVSTGLTATITPTSSSNKILCIYSTAAKNSSSANGSKFTLFRGTVSGTNLGHSSWGFGNFASTAGALFAPFSGCIVDNPSTTSAQLYTLAMAANTGITVTSSVANAPASLVLVEIAQ
jgi:hypothetical protein